MAEPATHAGGNLKLGLLLTAILFVSYYIFIILGVFAPGFLAKPVVSGGVVTIAIVYGLVVIALGVVLSGAYVFVSNAQQDRGL